MYNLKMESEDNEEDNLSLYDFTDLKIIGCGAQSVVYSGTYIKSGQKYALKKINKQNVSQMDNEIYILQHVKHPFILNLYGIINTPQADYLVLDLMTSNLFDILPLPVDQARYIAAEILLGLQQLHIKHIIMRDLTANNILIDDRRYIKISDFGLSVICERKSFCNQYICGCKFQQFEHATLCGTIYNLAPEVILKKGAKYYTDYWQLGNIIYQLITGYLPFSGSLDVDVTYQHILKEEVPQSPSLPDDAYDLIQQLMRKDGKQRMNLEAAKQHPFFKSIDWQKLKKREYTYWYPELQKQSSNKQIVQSFQSDEQKTTDDTDKEIRQIQEQRKRQSSITTTMLQNSDKQSDNDDCLCQFDDL